MVHKGVVCKPTSYLFKVFKKQEGLNISWDAPNTSPFFKIATFDQVSFGFCVWWNLQFGPIYSKHNYFYSMQLIFYYIRRKKNEFQCSSIGVGDWSFIKNIFFVFFFFNFSFKKFRQIDVHTLVSLDAKWLENRREFGGIGRVHPLAESEICNWFFSFFVGPCPFLAWLLRKIRELDHHLHRNTLSCKEDSVL